jgi:hypothetical protein
VAEGAGVLGGWLLLPPHASGSAVPAVSTASTKVLIVLFSFIVRASLSRDRSQATGFASGERRI